jgi:hypothetical protein
VVVCGNKCSRNQTVAVMMIDRWFGGCQLDADRAGEVEVISFHEMGPRYPPMGR